MSQHSSITQWWQLKAVLKSHEQSFTLASVKRYAKLCHTHVHAHTLIYTCTNGLAYTGKNEHIDYCTIHRSDLHYVFTCCLGFCNINFFSFFFFTIKLQFSFCKTPVLKHDKNIIGYYHTAEISPTTERKSPTLIQRSHCHYINVPCVLTN